MQNIKPFTTEIRNRGQLTIPKKIRDLSHLEEGQMVSIIPVGNSILISPKKLALDEARAQMRKLLKESGLSIDEAINALKEEREILYEETYGKKSHKGVS